MPDTDSVTLIKSFDYRGLPEEFSNTYHLEGTTPTNDAEWDALVKAIWASEKTLYFTNVKLVRAYGYNAGNENSVAQLDYALGFSGNVGTFSGTGAQVMQGDAAVMLRARAGTSTKGKKVYVRKYFHGSACVNGEPDKVHPDAKTRLVAHGNLLIGGTLPGGMKWCGPQGADASNPQAPNWTTTRTLKRRGKRP